MCPETVLQQQQSFCDYCVSNCAQLDCKAVDFNLTETPVVGRVAKQNMGKEEIRIFFKVLARNPQLSLFLPNINLR